MNQRESDLELAILSGHGKNGAISVLQRTVKPQIVTTFELPGCLDMWTVKTKNSTVGIMRLPVLGRRFSVCSNRSL